MTATVLVVDDDTGLRQMLQRVLERDGYLVRTASTGADALRSARDVLPDVVVLDVGLPDQSGLDVLSAIRRLGDVPVLMLTGRGAPADRVIGLDLGADDYLVKPASLDELVARVRALLRRAPAMVGSRLRDHSLDIDIDVAGRSIVQAGNEVVLTRLEFNLLVYLLRRPGQVVSRAEVLERVWGSSPDYQSEAVITEYMTRLRRKLGDLPVATVRGVGYRYDPDPQP